MDLIRPYTTESRFGIQIPVYASSNTGRLVDENTVRIQTKTDPEEEVENDGYTRYIEIEEFEPKNLRQQMSTFSVRGVPELKRGAVEKVLLLAIEGEFVWTVVEHLGERLIFVRTETVAAAEAVGEKLGPFDVVREHLAGEASEENRSNGTANGSASEQNGSANESSSSAGPIGRILSNKRNYASAGGTEDLDRVLRHYQSYNVASSDLVEVPKHMKDKIVDDIVRFRSHVLTIERNRRKKELELERIRTKNRLQQIFDSKIDDMDVEADVEADVEVDDEQVEAVDTVDPDDRAYRAKLARLAQMDAEKAGLQARLAALRSYEDRLVETKIDSIDALRAFEETHTAPARPNWSLYYADHSAYHKLRLQERAAEEKADLADEQAEIEDSSAQQTQQLLLLLKPADTSVEVRGMSDENLGLLRSKIGDLVEEYLGIKEEVLIEFIYTFLVENGLNKKNDLIKELEETLDEDSVVVVDELWQFITSLN